MTVHCAIFDCDGTLVDSERISMVLLESLLIERGVEMDHRELVREFAGGQLTRVLADIGARHGLDLGDAFLDEFRTRQKPILENELDAMPHIHAALDTLGLPMCVASNAPRYKIEICLRRCGLEAYFGDRLFSAYDVGRWKPDPGLLLESARAMGHPPERCVLVEDSPSGIEAGLAANMNVVAYRCRRVSDSRLTHIDCHRDLAAAIEGFA